MGDEIINMTAGKSEPLEATMPSPGQQEAAELVKQRVKLILSYVEDAAVAAMTMDPLHLAALTAAFFVPVIFLLWFCLRSGRLPEVPDIMKVAELDGEGSTRFRKRDKIAFMGRKVYRNAKAVGGFIKGGKGQKRRLVAKLNFC